MHTDEELAKKAKSGDDSAFSELVSRYATHAHNFVVYFTGEKMFSEDIVQDSFLKAWKNIHKFKTSRKFKPWFFAILKNTAIDILRKKKIRETVFSDELPDGIEDDEIMDNILSIPEEELPESIFEKEDLKGIVSDALLNISPEDRAIITLRYMEDLSFSDIARIVKMPENTVRSRHSRALVKIRRFLMQQNDYVARINK